MEPIKKLTPKHIKAAWIVAGVLLLLHFAPAVLHAVFAPFTERPQVAVLVKPSPGRPLPPSLPAASAPVTASLSRDVFTGVWQASQFMPNGDHCNIRLEIRPDNSNPVTGYDNVFGFDTRTCLSADLMKQANLPPAAMDRFRKETSPVSTAMKGTATEGSIVFDIDKTLGSAPTQCPMTAYTVSLFGSDAIAAQWKQGACPGGQAVLARVR
jgi:hypothetical protein